MKGGAVGGQWETSGMQQEISNMSDRIDYLNTQRSSADADTIEAIDREISALNAEMLPMLGLIGNGASEVQMSEKYGMSLNYDSSFAMTAGGNIPCGVVTDLVPVWKVSGKEGLDIYFGATFALSDDYDPQGQAFCNGSNTITFVYNPGFMDTY